jgi:hypothetical protein
VTRQETLPHVTIAYANTDDVPAADVIAVVEKLNASTARAEVTVEETTLVLLERRHHSYAWQPVSRITRGHEQPTAVRLAAVRR